MTTLNTITPATPCSYDELMSKNPTLIKELRNGFGHIISIYEDPEYGDESSLIGVITSPVIDEHFAFCTGFYDTDDYYIGSDYMPLIYGGKVLCNYQLNDLGDDFNPMLIGRV